MQIIGLICATWAQVEFAVDFLIAYLAGVPNQHTLRVLLDRRDIRPKIDMMKDLAERSKNQTIWAELQPVYRTLLKYIPKRNNAIHGLWTIGASGPNYKVPPTALLSKKRTMPADKLAAIAENIAIVSCHLFHIHWCHAYKKPVETSPWRNKLGPLDPL